MRGRGRGRLRSSTPDPMIARCLYEAARSICKAEPVKPSKPSLEQRRSFGLTRGQLHRFAGVDRNKSAGISTLRPLGSTRPVRPKVGLDFSVVLLWYCITVRGFECNRGCAGSDSSF